MGCVGRGPQDSGRPHSRVEAIGEPPEQRGNLKTGGVGIETSALGVATAGFPGREEHSWALASQHTETRAR